MKQIALGLFFSMLLPAIASADKYSGTIEPPEAVNTGSAKSNVRTAPERLLVTLASVCLAYPLPESSFVTSDKSECDDWLGVHADDVRPMTNESLPRFAPSAKYSVHEMNIFVVPV